MNKKSVIILKEELIRIILAVAVIILLIFTVVTLYPFGRGAEMQAKGTLEAIMHALAKANETGEQSLIIYNPAGWHIVAFNATHNENDDFRKPTAFFGKHTLCICEKGLIRERCKKEICRILLLPLLKSGTQANIPIQTLDLYFVRKNGYFEVSEKPIEKAKLTPKEKEEFEKTKWKLIEYENSLSKVAKQYYVQVRGHFADENDFRTFLEAVIAVESKGDANAISACGAVGLMQLMPDTARELGLKVPSYTELCNEGKGIPCQEPYGGCYYAFECNKETPQYCNETEDERFNPEKNLEAGTSYLVKLLKEFKDKALALAAYNAGEGSVRKYCKLEEIKDITSCPPGFKGRQYAEKVVAHWKAA